MAEDNKGVAVIEIELEKAQKEIKSIDGQLEKAREDLASAARLLDGLKNSKVGLENVPDYPSRAKINRLLQDRRSAQEKYKDLRNRYESAIS